MSCAVVVDLMHVTGVVYLKQRSDMTFTVDWALETNYLSICLY